MKAKRVIVFWILFLVCSANASEKDLLKHHPKIFKRSGNTVVIQIEENTSKKEYTDNLMNGEAFLKTTLEEYYKPLNLVLTRTQFYEGDTFRLISLSSGEELEIPIAPTWSADGQTFAIANDDESEYSENTFLIGKCSRTGCKKLLERKGRAGALKWKDRKSVVVEMRNYNPSSGIYESSKALECNVKGDAVTCPD